MVTGDHSDITLVCDDLVPFRAHKLVICSQSSVLKKVVTFFPENNSLLFLKGINSKDISNLLTYLYVGQVIVSSDDLKPLENLAHSFNIKANFEINDEEQLQDQIETHNFKLEDIFNEAEENVDDQKTIAELLGEVDCDLVIKGILDVEAQLNESEKNEDSNDKIKEKMSSNGGNKDPFDSNININKDKKDHNNHKIFQNSSQISLITNASQKVDFGKDLLYLLAFKHNQKKTLL